MKTTKESFGKRLVDELGRRGYDGCRIINNPWLPISVTYNDVWDCQYAVVYDDEQMEIDIMVNHICDSNELELLQQMVICNKFNSETRYARFFCNESGGIIARAVISCAIDNLIPICADVFEIVCEEVSALADYIYMEDDDF